jgi:hypothetical protein
MKHSSYRLGEFRIIEYENGLLWWERHHDFGVHRSGECFINGNVLIIGDWRQEENGSLIGEFLGQLKKFPVWGKTQYYCFASEIGDSNTNRKISEDILKRIPSLGPSSSGKAPSPKNSTLESFRLGRYRIIRNIDGAISWQTVKEINRIIEGRCFIESGILFLGSDEKEETEENKKEFLARLRQYPPWKSTIAWCRPGILRPILQPEQKGNQVKTARLIREEDPGHRDRPPDADNNKKDEPSKNTTPSESTTMHSSPTPGSLYPRVKRSIPKWPWSFGWKFWMAGFLLLILSGVILGMALFYYHSRGDRFHWPHWFKEHHGEHHSKEHHSRSNILVFTIMLILFLGIALPFNGAVRAEEKDIILEESGIHYPSGFDPNTVGEIQGKAIHFSQQGRGPIRFQLTSDRGYYTVLTSPHWFWHKMRAKISEGTEVVVYGSKSFGIDGNLYIVAQEVRVLSSGEIYTFRRKNGNPLWK